MFFPFFLDRDGNILELRMKGKYAEEYWSLKKSGHQSLKSDEMSFGRLETKHSLQIGS